MLSGTSKRRCGGRGPGLGHCKRLTKVSALVRLLVLLSALASGCFVKFEDQPPLCGDGLVADTEECDDGNQADGDGCNRACLVEPGWRCSGTAPSLCEPLCGDGRLVGDEPCDGSVLSHVNCSELGLGAGTLGCLENCTFDLSGCEKRPVCGNGKREYGEECDGEDLGGLSCVELGLGTGRLACDDACKLHMSG